VSILTIVSTVLGVISKQPFCHSAARVPETRLLPAAERDCHYHYQYLVQFQLVPPETLKTRLSLFRARSPSHPSCLSSKMQQNQRGRGRPTTARTLGPRIRRDQCHSFIGKQPIFGCYRGTNKTEAMHRALAMAFGHLFSGPRYSNNLLAEVRHRYNWRMSESIARNSQTSGTTMAKRLTLSTVCI
jgi:hypothetical protein